MLISDGVRELRNPRGDEFGYRGVEKALGSLNGRTAEATIQTLFHAMDEFSRGYPAHDDRTVLCIKIGKGKND